MVTLPCGYPGRELPHLHTPPPTAAWPGSPTHPLTVHGHAHSDALLETAQLALIAGDLVNDTAAVVFARVGGMEVLLDCAAKEALGWGRGGERQSMV